MSDQTEVPTDKAHQVAALSDSELDREFLDILSTATPAEVELLASLIRTEADRSTSIDQEAKPMDETATRTSAELVFDLIASKAAAIDSLCTTTINELPSANSDAATLMHDLEKVAQLLVAVRSLAQQVGWMADHHGGAGPIDACAWMMPPLYHDLMESERAGKR